MSYQVIASSSGKNILAGLDATALTQLGLRKENGKFLAAAPSPAPASGEETATVTAPRKLVTKDLRPGTGVYSKTIEKSGVIIATLAAPDAADNVYIVQFANGKVAPVPASDVKKSGMGSAKIPGIELASDVLAYVLVNAASKGSKPMSKDTGVFAVETLLATWFFRDYMTWAEIMEIETASSGKDGSLFEMQDFNQAVNDTFKVTVLDALYRALYAGGGMSSQLKRALRVLVSLYLANAGVRIGVAEDTEDGYVPLQNIKFK